MGCFIQVEQIQIFTDQFAETNISEVKVNDEFVAITTYKPFKNIKLTPNFGFIQEDIGTSGKI